MHELGIAMEIAEIATARAGDARLSRIVVEIGRLTAVLPDALRFAWDCAIEGSTLEGCALDIIEVAGRGKCRVCGSEQELAMPFGRCSCGTTEELELIGGEELRVRELEVR